MLTNWDSFDAYLAFSPNVWVDSQYKVLGRYIEDHTSQKLEDCFHESWDPAAIAQLIEDLAVPTDGPYAIGAVRVEFDLSSAMGSVAKPCWYIGPDPALRWGTKTPCSFWVRKTNRFPFSRTSR